MSNKSSDQEMIEFPVLSDDDIAFGFGRPATDTELDEYFSRTESVERIVIEDVFAKYK